MIARLVVLFAAVWAVVVPVAGADTRPARLLFPTSSFTGFGTPYSLTLANADGTDAIDVSREALAQPLVAPLDGVNAALYPTWSPDGSQIAFSLLIDESSSVMARAGDIYRVLPDGSGLRRLTFDGSVSVSNIDPVWSPDGARIAWIKILGNWHGADVWVMRADGADPHPVTTDGAAGAINGNLAWAPDGAYLSWEKSLRFAREGSVWTASRDGANLAQVSAGANVLTGSTSWQPHGHDLLWEEWPAAIVRVSGPDARVFPIAGANDAVTLIDFPQPAIPVWSPDGGRIAFTEQHGPQSTDAELVVVSLGGVRRVLASGYAYGLAFSPDGTQLAYSEYQFPPNANRYDGPAEHVFVADADAGGAREVSGNGANDAGWWPDGSRLLLRGFPGLETVNADGKCKTKLALEHGLVAGGGSGGDAAFGLEWQIPLGFGIVWQPGDRQLSPPVHCVTLGLAGRFDHQWGWIGTTRHFDVTVTNRGNYVSSPIVLTGVVRRGIAAGHGCTGNRKIRCRLPPLKPGASAHLRLDVTAQQLGPVLVSLRGRSGTAKPATLTRGFEAVPHRHG
jgi:Tol biopolymer transport system component